MSNVNARMRQLIGTPAEYAANDLVIGNGEIAVEHQADGSVKMKVGDGTLQYSKLPYFGGGGVGSRSTPQTLTSAVNIAVDMKSFDNFTVTLANTAVLDDPTNVVAGNSGAIVIDNGAGTFDMTFGANWKFEGGTKPTLTKTANAKDVLVYYADSATSLTAKLIRDVK